MSIRERIDSVRDSRPTPTESWEYALRLDACWRRGQLIPADDAAALSVALEKLDTPRDRVTAGLATQVARQTDNLILRAIDEYTTELFTLGDVAARGHRTTMPDGSEIFTYDNVPLIRFEPVSMGVEVKNHSYSVTVSRRYEKLFAR